MKRNATLVSALLLGVPFVAAAEGTPTYYFDCDAPEERAAIWTRDLTSLPAMIAGIFEVVEVKSHPKWLASFAMVIRNPDGASSSGLRVGWPAAKPRDPFIEALAPRLRAANERQSAPWTKTGKVPFSISVSAEGVALFKVGDLEFRDSLDLTKPLKFALTCSTAEVVFESVRVE